MGRLDKRTAGSTRWLAMLAVGAALAVAGCGGSSSDSTSGGGGGSATEITFAGLFDLSGPLATFGKSCEKGLQLAAMQINGEGGFTVAGKTYKVKVDVADGRSDPTASVAAARNVLQAGHKFLFGPDSDATSLQILGVTKDADLLQFSGGASSQKLIGHAGHETTFGVVSPNAVWQGSFVSLLRAAGVKSGTVAIVYPNDASGQAVGPEVQRILDEHGYDAKVFLFPPATTDFRSLMTRVKASNPDAVLDGYTAQWGLPIAQAAVQLKAADAIVGWNQSPESVPLVIAKSLNKPFPLRWVNATNDQQAASPTTASTRAFRAAWIKYFHEKPTADESQVAIWFYNAAMNAVQAMKHAGTVTDVKAIANALKSSTFHAAETIDYNDTNLPVHGTDYAIVDGNAVDYHYLPPPGS